ncbi:MAG TPA: hypothetical protein VM409_07075 [Chloroflexia bacterium]|nr:hypothetical protein [Chloroflexia bacterium]
MARKNQDNPLAAAAQGMLAGAGGAVVLTVITAAGQNIMSGPGEPKPTQNSEGISAGEALFEGPDMPPNISRITATFVQKVATGLFGTSLTADEQYIAGNAWHLAYGGFWGAVYSLLSGSVGLPRVVLGPLFGIALWALGPGWLVPKMKIMLPPTEQEPRTTAMVLGAHAAYGTITALILGLIKHDD